MTVHHRHNPPAIHAPRGYSHVVEASAPGRTIYIAGQVGVSSDGKIAPDFRGQAAQCFENLKAALAAAGAGFEHVVKTTNYFIDIGQIAIFREVRDRYIDTKAPPASTAVQVVKLAAPEFLFEIEAIAVVQEK
jgi:enamine deaminase RidA (YjgF/YER057c/UK114 family)